MAHCVCNIASELGSELVAHTETSHSQKQEIHWFSQKVAFLWIRVPNAGEDIFAVFGSQFDVIVMDQQ